MTKISSFEDLVVWQKARELTNLIYQLTNNLQFKKDFGLVDQIRRASVSITSNIAEGFERGTQQEFINHLFIAKGSCGEVRSQLYTAHDQKYFNNTDNEKALNLCMETSRLLYSFINKVKDKSKNGLQRL